MKPTFAQWMGAVDLAVARLTGLSVLDLPDVSFRDWFDDGVPSLSAAKRAIRAAKADM